MKKSNKLEMIVTQMIKTGVLEDRREYDQDMLATMYGLTPEEASDLYLLVQSHFRVLPADYRLSKGPNGTVSVQCISEPGCFYSLAAWQQIERGEGLWKDAHKAIFGSELISTAPRCNRLTKKEALKQIRALGLTLKTTDGEHRVAYRGMSAAEAEKKAYYTNDLDDAVATAIEMAAWLKRQAARGNASVH